MIKYVSVEDLAERVKDMKFDIIVGNPPYQKSGGNGGTCASALYPQFVDLAKKLNPETISMVIPSRWFCGGKRLDKFREEMMEDKCLKLIVDYPDSQQVFPKTSINGGVCYFHWDKKHGNSENPKCLVKNIIDGKVVDESLRKLNEYDIVLRFGKDIPILKKIQACTGSTIDEHVYGQEPFSIPTNFSNYSKEPFESSVKLYVRRDQGYIAEDIIKKNKSLIGKHKVILAKAYGESSFFPNIVIGRATYAGPGTVCSNTYLVCGTFNTSNEAENFISYMKTRIFRFLVLMRKNTQDINPDKFKFVPDLPMTEKWTDEKLCKRWKITKEEFAYISSRVKEMN
jgi:site-specific DNA-methyltransferase (adenine-specific)